MSSKPKPSQKAGQTRAAKIAARRRRGSSTRVLWLAVLFLVLAVIAGIGIQATRTSGKVTKPTQALGPNNGEVLGSDSAPVTVEEYGDFQCPHCTEFERTVGPTVRKLVDEGRIRFVYHPVAILGPESLDASNAAVCAGEQGRFWQYHDVLFQNAPRSENSGLLSTGRLQGFGQQAGVGNGEFDACVKDGTYDQWVQQITDQASQRGVTGTPTILVNGQVVRTATTPAGLIAAVDAATKR